MLLCEQQREKFMKIWNVLGRLALAAALGSALTFPAYAKEKAGRVNGSG